MWKQLEGTAKDMVSNEKHTLSMKRFIVRTNGKWAKNTLIGRLPYHPQAFDAGTQFVAELEAPLRPKAATFRETTNDLIGTPPPPDSILHASADHCLEFGQESHWGDQVEAVLTEL